jgi:demethylsterigmatocystin 6-O-methyltransferase
MQSLTTYRFDNMGPAFLHMPTHFASTNYAEPTSQETSPYFQLFNRGFWDRVNASPKLKREFDTYMAAHKKGGSSLVDLLPLSRLVSGYNAAFPVLLVDIGGNVGHQCIELKTRYPDLQGGVVVQDLKCAEDLGAGVKGMEYDFFTPQPIKGKLHTLSSAFQKSQHP